MGRGGEGAAGSRIANKGGEKDAKKSAKRVPGLALGIQKGSFLRPVGSLCATQGHVGHPRGHLGVPGVQKVDRPDVCQTFRIHFLELQGCIWGTIWGDVGAKMLPKYTILE